MRTFLDIFFTTIIFTTIFFISYKVLVIFEMVPSISWYLYFLIGFVQTFLFRLLGRLIGVKHASGQIFKN